MAVAQKTITITNKVGLHARPAALFVQTAARFAASIHVSYNGRSADAKRILQVLQLGAEQGASLQVQAEGTDAAEAVAALDTLAASRFGEPE